MTKIDLPGAEFSPRAENLEAWTLSVCVCDDIPHLDGPNLQDICIWSSVIQRDNPQDDTYPDWLDESC